MEKKKQPKNLLVVFHRLGTIYSSWVRTDLRINCGKSMSVLSIYPSRLSLVSSMCFPNQWEMEYFLAKLANKDVTVISDSSPPNVNFWALRRPRKNNTSDPTAIRLQPLPMVNSEELRMWINTRYWPPIGETHMKGMISVSPALISLTSDIWFPLINNNLLLFRLPALCCKTSM